MGLMELIRGEESMGDFLEEVREVMGYIMKDTIELAETISEGARETLAELQAIDERDRKES